MFIEVKTLGKQLSDSQRDTMHIVDQLFRNDRTTPTKQARTHVNLSSDSVYSPVSEKWIRVKALGYHLLRINGCTPDDSTKIQWDKKQTTKDTLLKILKFEAHPDTLRPMDLRNHHDKINKQPVLI